VQLPSDSKAQLSITDKSERACWLAATTPEPYPYERCATCNTTCRLAQGTVIRLWCSWWSRLLSTVKTDGTNLESYVPDEELGTLESELPRSADGITEENLELGPSRLFWTRLFASSQRRVAHPLLRSLWDIANLDRQRMIAEHG
jgi:hypothetical protein